MSNKCMPEYGPSPVYRLKPAKNFANQEQGITHNAVQDLGNKRLEANMDGAIMGEGGCQPFVLDASILIATTVPSGESKANK